MNLPITHVRWPLAIRKRLPLRIYRIRVLKLRSTQREVLKLWYHNVCRHLFLRSITPYLIIYNCVNITEALIAEELLSFPTPLTFSQILVKNNYILDSGMGLMTFQRGRAVCFEGAAVFLDQPQITDLYVSQIKTSCYRWPETKDNCWISDGSTGKPNKSQDLKGSPIYKWRGWSSSRLGVKSAEFVLT